MKTRTKIIFFMLISLILYGIFVVFLNKFSTEQVTLTLNDDKKKKTEQMEQAVDLIGTSQKALVNDYSIWNDAVQFTKDENREFTRVNLDTALAFFGVDQIWVYGTDGKELYLSSSAVPSPNVEDFSIPRDVQKKLHFDRKINYFVETPNGIMEISGATIHTSDNHQRTTEPAGYFFAGRIINEKALEPLSSLVGSKVNLRQKNIPEPAISIDQLSAFSIHKTLKDWSGNEVAFLDTEIRSSIAEELSGSSSDFIFITIIFGIISLTILFLLLYLFVSRPLQTLYEGLISKDIGKLKKMESRTDEFGQLALTINSFFEQDTKIEQEKSKLDALLENINDNIIGIDRNWNIVFLNRTAEAFLGLNFEEVTNKPFRNFFKILKTRDRSENINFIEEALLYGKPTITSEDIYVLSKSGEEVPVVCSAASILGHDKQVIGAVITVHNTSKERETQRLRSDFAYASHQLRTPVTEASWAVDAAIESKDKKTQSRNLKVAAKSIESVHKLVEHLLTVSLLDQNLIATKTQKFKLFDTFKNAIASLHESSSKRKIEIKYPEEGIPQVLETDGNILQKVLFEIIDNAILYGKKESEVFLNVSSQIDGTLISIENTGITIPENELPLVFTKFFRGGNITDEVPGAGLGLYIAREYIRLLNGKIWFTSENSKTTFFVSIPNKKSEDIY